MPIQNNIYRTSFGPPRDKNVFTLAMIDSGGAIRSLPFPPVEGNFGDDEIYGVELMVNPASISNNMSKIVSRSQTMTGFIEEHWGEELDTITFQGSTAAFVSRGQDTWSVRNTMLDTRGFYDSIGFQSQPYPDVGLTTARRRLSVSYKHFKRILDLFRINGCFYDNYRFIQKRYHIMLAYGYSAYYGYFESVDVTEDAANPYRFIYTITFKAEETLYSYVNQAFTSV